MNAHRTVLSVVILASLLVPPDAARASTAPRLTIQTQVVRAAELVRVRLESAERAPGSLHVYTMIDDSEFVNYPVTDPNPDATRIDLDLFYNTMTGEYVFAEPGTYVVKALWESKDNHGHVEVTADMTVHRPLRRDRRALEELLRGGSPLAAYLGRGGGRGCAAASEHARARQSAWRLAHRYPRSPYGRTARAAIRSSVRCRTANWNADPKPLLGDATPLPDDIEMYPGATLEMSAPGDHSHTGAMITCDDFPTVISYYTIALKRRGWNVQDSVWYRQGGAVVAWNEHPEKKVHVSAATEWCGVTAITISFEDIEAMRRSSAP